MAVQFYRGPNSDPYAARVIDDGVPEIFHETTRSWAPYPALDTIHEARRCSAEVAMASAPGMTRAELEKGLPRAPVGG